MLTDDILYLQVLFLAQQGEWVYLSMCCAVSWHAATCLAEFMLWGNSVRVACSHGDYGMWEGMHVFLPLHVRLHVSLPPAGQSAGLAVVCDLFSMHFCTFVLGNKYDLNIWMSSTQILVTTSLQGVMFCWLV